MATDDDDNKTDATEGEEPSEGRGASSDEEVAEPGEPTGASGSKAAPEAIEDEAPAAAQLGATRYVMAGFFVTAIAAAYVVGRFLSAIWGKLAEAVWFQKNVAFLARVGEEERSEYATVIGAVLALGSAVYAYRRADVRQWTDEVASELSKVTWPDKAEVTSSTVVVIVTSAFATVYLALLDRFWGFVTNLVYGG